MFYLRAYSRQWHLRRGRKEELGDLEQAGWGFQQTGLVEGCLVTSEGLNHMIIRAPSNGEE